ncbi:MAG TPA: hypothetical protein VIK55_17375 [Paludibacter sp.]
MNATENDSVDVRMVMPFKASNMIIHLYNRGEPDFAMYQSALNEFRVKVPKGDGYFLFNISYVPEFNDDEIWFIAGGKLYSDTLLPSRFDSHGIKYGKLYINNQLLNYTYTIDNKQSPKNRGLNISVNVNNDGSIFPAYNDTDIRYELDTRIPTEVAHRYGFVNTAVPSLNDIKVCGWMQAIIDTSYSGIGKVEVDYIKLYGFTGNNSTFLKENEYNTTYSPDNDGGLYYRFPFFPKGDYHDRMPGNIKDGILTFYPSDSPKKVWHWWTPQFESANGFNFYSYKTVCRIRLTGPISVQAGIDFRDSSEKNIHELGVSEWYFENGGDWQIVTFDSKAYLTDLVKPELVESRISLEVLKSKGFLKIKYFNLEPGNYVLCLYNIEGKKLVEINVIIKSNDKESTISLPVVFDNMVILYRLSNGVISLKGKVL